MSDNEIEDISFLPESPRSSKRSLYEYEAERCRQFLCSQKRAVCVICSIIVALFVVALVVAIARPPCIPCERDFKVQSPPNASAENVVPTATNGEPFPWSDVRLPDAVIPETYSIFMHPNLTTFTFSGHVNISLYVKKSTDFIIFHERGLNLTSISLKSLSTDGSFSITVVKQLEYVPNQQFLIRLGQELTAGSRCVLSIFFTGALSPNLASFYKSSYQLANGDRRWLGVTQFEATDARGAFPCFDEPAMKANFSLSIVRPKDYITLFNTPKKLSRPLGRDSALVVDEYPYSVRMSSYLVAFVICDFSSNSTTSSTGIKVSVYAQPQLIQQGQFALEVGAKVIDYYSDYFGIAYPLDKQDMVAVPDMSPGAMENWGLITYRQTILLYEPREASASDQQLTAVVIAHELAHQWFGNLVTMKWWNDLWLNEGFASYVEFLGANVSKPEWRMLDQLISDTLVPALHKDSLWNSHPISADVHDPSEINDLFDMISYDKGCCILRMLEHYMGASSFKNGLRSYLKRHAYANADSDDLWAALTEQSNGIEVKSFMDTWIKQMGYPVVIVEQTGDTVTLRQERFLTNPRANITVQFTSPYGYKWKIPVDYTTDAQSQNTAYDVVWLDPQVNSEVKFSLANSVKWLKLNVGQHGFYRVHYTPALWRALADQLNADHTVLSAADRAGLVDDVFYLARSGHVNITLAMDVSKYLAREADYVPWSVALTNLMYIEHLLQNHASYDRYKSYLLSLMADKIKALGWRDEGSLLDIYLRDYLMAIALQLGDKFVLNQAMESFRAWRSGTRVWANLKTVVYQAGVQYGSDEDWQYVYERYKREIIPSEKRKLLHSLSASNDISRLNRLLQLSLQEDEVRQGDSVSVVTGVASRNTASAALAWHFVKLHWPEFYSRYGEGQFEMTALILHTTSLFKTPYEYEEVRDFYASHLNRQHQRSVAQALETIDVNIDWLARNEDDIVRWLDANVKI